ILTPALCATLLRPSHGLRETGPLGLFNRGYERTSGLYQRFVAVLIARRRIVMLGFVAIAIAVGSLFVRMPTGFLPEEDQGQIMVQVMLPPGSTMEQTRAVMARVDAYFAEAESTTVESTM